MGFCEIRQSSDGTAKNYSEGAIFSTQSGDNTNLGSPGRLGAAPHACVDDRCVALPRVDRTPIPGPGRYP